MEAFSIYVIKSAAVLVLFFSVYWIFLKKDTNFKTNRYFLLIGVVCSILVPFLEITNIVYIPTPTQENYAFSESIPLQTATDIKPIDWWSFLGITYIIVILFFLVRFFKKVTSLVLLLKSKTIKKQHGFKYVIVSENISPFSFLTYIVYNPNLHSQEDLDIILKHERVHARQWHSIDIVLAQLLTVFQWFNPIAWLYQKSISENLEYLADQETASVVSSKKAYQLALVQASSSYAAPALTTNFYQSFIKKRIVMLNKNSSNKSNSLKAFAVVPLLALFLWSFNTHDIIEYTPAIEKATSENVTPASEKTPFENTSELPSEKETIPTKTNQTTATPSNSVLKKQVLVQDSAQAFQIRITKNTTIEELKKYKRMLKEKHNATFNYRNVNFNSKGEITSISISYSDARGNNNNYSVNSSEPISDFILSVSENGTISSRTVMTEDQKARRDKILAEKDAMLAKREVEIEKRREQMEKRREEVETKMEERRASHEERMERQRARMKNRSDAMKERVEIIRSRENDSTRFIIKNNGSENRKVEIIASEESNSSDNPIYIVDGKEITEQDVKKIKPETIKKINVLKGKKAIKEYGGKAINGVIEITTKQ